MIYVASLIVLIQIAPRKKRAKDDFGLIQLEQLLAYKIFKVYLGDTKIQTWNRIAVSSCEVSSARLKLAGGHPSWNSNLGPTGGKR